MIHPDGPRIRFSVRLPQAYCVASPNGLLEVATAAEEAGLWGVSVQDHIITTSGVSFCGPAHDHRGDDRNMFEALQTLAFVAGHTETVKLISTVLVTPFRNAVLLAKEIASLDRFSNGRVIVGTGVGAPRRAVGGEVGGQNLSAHAEVARREYEAFDVRGHRGRLADESLQVMKAIWTQETATFHGEYYSFEGLSVYPKPAQRPRPPLWVGGRSRASQARSITLGDAWCPSQISPAAYREGMAWMSRYARENALPMPRDNVVNLFATIDDDRRRALTTNRRTFGHRFSEEGLDAVTLAGDAESVVDQLHAFIRAGVTVFDLKLIPPTAKDNLRQLAIFRDAVLPHVLGDPFTTI